MTPSPRTSASRLSRRIPGLIAAPALLIASLSAPGCSSIQARVEMKKGNQYYNTKHYEEAVQSYRRVIEIQPEYKDAYFNLGLAYLSLYQPGSTHEKDIAYSQGAIQAFKDFLKLEPESEKVKNFLVEVCQKSNNHEEAVRFFEAEHARHPDDIRTIGLIASLYTKMNEIDLALTWIEKRIGLEPSNPEAHYSFAQTTWARSHNHMDLSVEERFAILDKGLRAADKAIELKPEYWEAYTSKNLILRQKALYEPIPAQRLLYTQEADLFQKKAMELLNAQKQAAQAEGKAGAL